MKFALINGFPDLPGIVDMLVYDTKPVNFLLICYNAIKWVQKKRQVHDPKTNMVCDAQFLSLNINDSYYYNINPVDLSDQLRNVY